MTTQTMDLSPDTAALLHAWDVAPHSPAIWKASEVALEIQAATQDLAELDTIETRLLQGLEKLTAAQVRIAERLVKQDQIENGLHRDLLSGYKALQELFRQIAGERGQVGNNPSGRHSRHGHNGTQAAAVAAR